MWLLFLMLLTFDYLWAAVFFIPLMTLQLLRRGRGRRGRKRTNTNVCVIPAFVHLRSCVAIDGLARMTPPGRLGNRNLLDSNNHMRNVIKVMGILDILRVFVPIQIHNNKLPKTFAVIIAKVIDRANDREFLGINV